MKVILTGASGFIGSHILTECLASPDITSVIILTRRSLENNAAVKDNPKVTAIIHEDFSQYPPSLLEQLKGAGACIWAIGGRVTQFPDLHTAKRVGIDYTIAGATAFLEHVAPTLETGQKFRFVYCSGWGATEDQNKKLFIVPDSRKIKGAVEKGLFDLTQSHPDNFELYCLRPAAVIPAGRKSLYYIASAFAGAVMVTDLAKAFVTVAAKGYTKPIIENTEFTKLVK